MESRVKFATAAPEGTKAFRVMHTYLQQCSLPRQLLELVNLRVSQINGCAYCLDLHARDLRKLGERQQRLDCLAAWREVPFFDDRERAALAWAESLTRIDRTGAPEAEYAPLTQHFTETEIADLTFAIANINMMNRVGVGLRMVPKSA
jgi:AhpD family alkylhydroperoxidase